MILRDYLRQQEIPEKPVSENPRMCTDKERQEILERDNYTCRYCGAKNTKFHIDHVYPYSFRGLTIKANLATACSVCNWKKHNKIGIWPKPIGYFEPEPKIVKVAFGALICTTLAMVLLYNGIDVLINFPPFRVYGLASIFFGMVLGLVSIGLQTQGK